MRGNETPGRIVTNFCTGVGVHDVITYANFYDCPLWGLSVVGVKFWVSPLIDLCRRPYNTLALPCELWFSRWLHPAMWHVALESWQWIHHVAAPCNVVRKMTCHWISPNVRHIGILLLVSISTILPQSTCHSAPASLRNFIEIGHPRQKNYVMSKWHGGSPPSWILGVQ